MGFKLGKQTRRYNTPDHNPIFQVEVSVVKLGKFVGRGSSKKVAEQEAARQLLQKVKSKSDTW